MVHAGSLLGCGFAARLARLACSPGLVAGPLGRRLIAQPLARCCARWLRHCASLPAAPAPAVPVTPHAAARSVKPPKLTLIPDQTTSRSQPAGWMSGTSWTWGPTRCRRAAACAVLRACMRACLRACVRAWVGRSVQSAVPLQAYIAPPKPQAPPPPRLPRQLPPRAPDAPPPQIAITVVHLGRGSYLSSALLPTLIAAQCVLLFFRLNYFSRLFANRFSLVDSLKQVRACVCAGGGGFVVAGIACGWWVLFAREGGGRCGILKTRPIAGENPKLQHYRPTQRRLPRPQR